MGHQIVPDGILSDVYWLIKNGMFVENKSKIQLFLGKVNILSGDVYISYLGLSSQRLIGDKKEQVMMHADNQLWKFFERGKQTTKLLWRCFLSNLHYINVRDMYEIQIYSFLWKFNTESVQYQPDCTILTLCGLEMTYGVI